MEVDFLLIGQGLAGTGLAYRLHKSGKKILVIDDPSGNQSSRVAAGLYNPITGKKMVKTWYLDKLFPEIEPFYRELEDFLGLKFLVSKPIYRPFLNIEEQNEWMAFSGESDFTPYISEVSQQSISPKINNLFGGVTLKNSGYLKINVLLDGFASFLQNEGLLRREFFDEGRLVHEKNGHWTYNDINAKAIVYCNGLGAMRSRFFKDLPFAPVKGEILDLEQGFDAEQIINRGVFRISLGNGIQRVGSTYSWHDLDQGPTERGKLELLEKLEKLVPEMPSQIIHHKSGIRPATKDRRPFLGRHPEFDSIYIFNGLGAKGVSLLPYFSKKMLELLIYEQEPEKAVNINRFQKT